MSPAGRPTRIVCVCGSLRRRSLHRAVLKAASGVAPPGVIVRPPLDLDQLTLFNPDLQGSPPIAVAGIRSSLAEADAVLISSPEYAHGVTGTLKTLLDWLVTDGEIHGKPVGVLNASPHAHLAFEATLETLHAMEARPIAAACVRVPLPGAGADPVVIAAHPPAARTLAAAVGALAAAAH